MNNYSEVVEIEGKSKRKNLIYKDLSINLGLHKKYKSRNYLNEESSLNKL